MKYTVSKSLIWVLGELWWPMGAPASKIIEMREGYDIDNARDENGDLTRASVGRWLVMNEGDFSRITDWRASIEDGDQTVEYEWAKGEDSELAYSDTLGEEF